MRPAWRTADSKILFGIQEHLRCGLGDRVIPRLSALGNGGAVWLCSAAVALCFERTQKTGVNVLQALFFAIVLILLLKRAFCRPRPCDEHKDVKLLIRRPPDHSFPSGHALSSFAAATALAAAGPLFGIPALCLAMLIAFSRLYLFVHYPADVLAGSVLGVMAGLMAVLL